MQLLLLQALRWKKIVVEGSPREAGFLFLELWYNIGMTNFPEFFELLRSIVSKTETEIVPTDENFDMYLATRYLSFIHPEICKMLATCVNKHGFVNDLDNATECFNALKAIIPKMPYPKIKYISKPSSKKMRERGIDEETLKTIAYNMELGRREVSNLI